MSSVPEVRKEVREELREEVRKEVRKEVREEEPLAAPGCRVLSAFSVCSSTGLLLSGGAEKNPAGLCL